MVGSLDLLGSESDFGLELGLGAFFYRDTGVGLPCCRTAAADSRSTGNDIDLPLDRTPGARSGFWFLELVPEVTSSDQFLDLILEVAVVFRVMAVVSMELVIFRSILVSSL